MESATNKSTPTAAAPPLPSPPHHHNRYSNVKWYHAVNGQQKLVEAAQEITRLYFGEDPPRRSSVERSPSASSANEPAKETDAILQQQPSSASIFTPPYRVFGIEADVQWHPSLETAVMRHDALPDSADASLAAGSPSSASSPESGLEDLLTLEVFLYTVAQAVQGWRTRTEASSCAPPGPMRIVVKLDVKAFKAAQQLLAQAETRTWAGLESLCVSSSSSHASRSRRRPSLRSFVAPRLEAGSSGSMPAAPSASIGAAAAASATPPSVHVELWWNADVIAQPGAQVHPLSVAAAPRSAVLQLLTRTAQALGPRIAFGFSLGWVLCPRVVPAEVLAKAPSRSINAPVFVSYSETDDVPPMTAFLEGLAQALAGEDASPAGAASLPACVYLVTFPMLFESVFADAYAASEEGEAPSIVEAATKMACVLRAAECRRVAAAVVDHAARLFFAPRTTGSVSGKAEQGEGSPSSSSSTGAAATTTTTTTAQLSRCFPTFWKAIHRPPTPSSAEEGQADVNRAARVFFPYCTIDG